MKQVVLLQRIIPKYRVDFFQNLHLKLKESGINLIVIHSSIEIENSEVFLYLRPTINKEISFLKKQKMILSLNLYKVLRNISPSLILTEDISNLPNGLIVTLYCKLNKCKYGIMGLGRILNKKRSFVKVLLGWAINIFRENALFFMSYSSTGARYYEDLYKKASYYWCNSIVDIQKVSEEHIREKYQLEKFNIIFIGRVEKFKRLDILIKALESINNPLLNLYIIGDGSEKKVLENDFMNTTTQLHWLGKIEDKNEKEKYIRKSHLGVMPGSGGLVIQELQSYGIPVIASYSDGTEIDLVKLVNPSLFIEDISVNSLQESIESFLSLDLEIKLLKSKKSLEVIKNSYNLKNMVKIASETIIKYSKSEGSID